ncbi:uncharacterized protein G2W53_017123 [Senna tora]|uniref:Uncharacterized protein n=1 Tax=Senna tora TaxID=362788 RepID=A0A834TXR3_9FABA|nr:uncharacterized protein G2W53_017123 [Senna tora]
MKCKKHYVLDPSSNFGVCASCLRERLLTLIAEQEKAHQARVASRASEDHHHPRKSDPNPPPPPPPLVFPRSVSPYVSRRKSDYANNVYDQRHNSLFYSTPQVGPTFAAGGGDNGNTAANSAFGGRTRAAKKKLANLWIFSGLFRSRSDKFEANHRVSSQESCEPSSSSASPSWFSMIFPSRQKNLERMRSLENSTNRGRRRRHRQTDRGMSPVRAENLSVDCDGCDRSSPSASGYSTETSPKWRKTPSVAPCTTRRSRQGRNVTGMAFCLSPLVRASPNPNPHWNPKMMPPDVTASGEIRGCTAKPHISTASSFCANRSRKLADFGRANQNR